MSQFGPPGNPGLVLQCEPEIRRLVDEKIDALQPGPIDVVDDFAYPIPVALICRLLGVAPSDEPRFHAWADTIVESIDPADQPNAEELTRKGNDATLPSSAISASSSLSAAPTRPTTLLSRLANAPADEALSDIDLQITGLLLLIAGHETTVNLITDGMLTLCAIPSTWIGCARTARSPCRSSKSSCASSPRCSSREPHAARRHRRGGVTIRRAPSSCC